MKKKNRMYVIEKERRNKDVFETWKENNEKFFDEEQIESMVDKYVNKSTNYCFHDWLESVICILNKHCGSRKKFCYVSGAFYIHEIGCKMMIEYFLRKEMVLPEDAEKWKTEIGLTRASADACGN